MSIAPLHSVVFRSQKHSESAVCQCAGENKIACALCLMSFRFSHVRTHSVSVIKGDRINQKKTTHISML